MTPEHFTAQKMKKAYYLAQKTPDQVGDCLPSQGQQKASLLKLLEHEGNQFFFCLGQGFLTQVRDPLGRQRDVDMHIIPGES